MLYRLADISVTGTEVRFGRSVHPLAGTRWTVFNQTMTRQRISPIGWILAIVFVWACLLGLLFLLIREDYVDGYAQVTVDGEGFSHSVQIPVNNLRQVGEIESQVQGIRRLAGDS